MKYYRSIDLLIASAALMAAGDASGARKALVTASKDPNLSDALEALNKAQERARSRRQTAEFDSDDYDFNDGDEGSPEARRDALTASARQRTRLSTAILAAQRAFDDEDDEDHDDHDDHEWAPDDQDDEDDQNDQNQFSDDQDDEFDQDFGFDEGSDDGDDSDDLSIGMNQDIEQVTASVQARLNRAARNRRNRG